MEFAWAKNLDGLYYRTLGFCRDEDCASTQGWEGKEPDLVRGAGTVRGSYFFECETCGRKSRFSAQERERSMDAIFTAQRMEQALVSWPVLSYGTSGTVQWGPLTFAAEVIGYGRDPFCGYLLNGTMIVRTRARVGVWYRKGALVDIGTSLFTAHTAHLV